MSDEGLLSIAISDFIIGFTNLYKKLGTFLTNWI